MHQNEIERSLPASPGITGKRQAIEGIRIGWRRWSFWTTPSVLALALLAGALGAQTVSEATPSASDTEQALHAMLHLAGVIFAGRVTAIHRQEGSSGATGFVEIEFAVEDAVRGVSGSSYTLREGAALWPAGDSRFRPGQRYLMLLHTPGPSGLSSPVGGMDGAIPIRGSVEYAPQSAVASARVVSTESDNSVVDLRWIAARVERPVSYRINLLPARPPAPAHPSALAAAVAQSQDAAVAASESAPYASVMGALRTWIRDDNEMR